MKKAKSIHFSKSGPRHGMLLLLALLLMSMLPKSAAAQIDLARLMTLDDGITVEDRSVGYYRWTESDKEGYMPGVMTTIRAAASGSQADAMLTLRITSQKDFLFSCDYMFPNDPMNLGIRFSVDGVACKTAVLDGTPTFSLPITAGTHDVRIDFLNNSSREATAYIYRMKATTAIDKPQEKRPVAVYNKRNKTFIFYYDTEMRPFDGENIIYNVSAEGDPAWDGSGFVQEETKTIVFDPSFSDYRPKTVRYWFNLFESLTQLRGMENLNTSETEDFAGMFEGCKSLKSIDLSHLDTSKGKDLGDMFSYCSSLETLDLSGFNTEACEDMMSMFSNCTALKELDLSAFNTANVGTMMYMFEDCENLQTIYATDAFTTSQVSSSNRMFTDCYKLKGAIEYNSSSIDATYANYTTGYFTKGCLHTDASGNSTLGNPVVREATCVEGAHTEYTCSLCQRTKKVYSSAANPDAHSIKKHEAVEPACGKEGNKEYYACELCEKIWLDAALTKEVADESEYVIRRTGHVLDKNGDCTGCHQHVMTLNGVTAQFYNIDDTSWEILNNEEEGRQGLVNYFDNNNPLAIVLTSDKDFELSMGFTTSASLTFVADGKTYDMYNNPGAYKFKAGTRKFVIKTYGYPGRDTQLFDIKATISKPMNPAESCGKIVYDKKTNVATLYSNDKAPAESDNLTVTSLPSFDEFPSSPWFSNREDVEKVVIDESFKGVKPKSTVAWFAGLRSCKEIVGLENLDLSETTTTAYMFYYGCYIETLDLTTFNTAKVKDMSGMFADCYGLTTIYAGEGFSTASVEKSDGMFRECFRLKGAANFSDGKTNHECANYETGYFTKGCLHKDAAGNSTLVKKEDVAADCQTAAYAIYECGICHRTVEADFTGEPDLTKHKLYLVNEAVESSCTVGGIIAVYRCEVCNKRFDSEDATHEISGDENVEIPALGHDFDDSYTCRRCGVTDLRYKALNLKGVKAIIFDKEDYPWKLTDENNASKGLMSGIKDNIPCGSGIGIRLISDKPFRMDYGYKASTGAGNDEFRISVDGTELPPVSGDKEGSKTQYFFAGTHDITFAYFKRTVEENSNAAWLTSFSATDELTAEDQTNSLRAAAVIDYNNMSLTWKAVDINTELLPTEKMYEIDPDDTNFYANRPWNEFAYEATSVRIDESFSQFRPKSISRWFAGLGVDQIDGLQYLNTSETEDFSCAFRYNYVNTLDLSTFDTSKGKYFYDMFYNSSSLQELDLTSFDMSSAENTRRMFDGCVSLDKIYVNKHFGLSDVANEYSDGMFADCILLSGGKEYDMYLTDGTMANYHDGYLSTYYKVGDKHFALNGDMTVDNLVLEDGKPFMTHDAFTAKKATLRRTLQEDNAQNIGTICLPYAVKATGDYTLYAVKSVGAADEPTNAKNAAAADATYSTLYLEKINGELPAGTPAIFKAQTKTVDFAAADAAVIEQPADDETLAHNGFMLRGAFTEYDVEPESYVYAGGEFVRASSLSADGTAIKGSPLTACLTALPGFGITADRLYMESDDNVISAVKLVESLQNGKAEIYDMNGVRLQQLQPGVNIIRHANGKTQKVVVK